MTPFTSGYYLTQLQAITLKIAEYSLKSESVSNDTDKYQYQNDIDALIRQYKYFESMYTKAINEENGTQDTMGYIPRYEFGI